MEGNNTMTKEIIELILNTDQLTQAQKGEIITEMVKQSGNPCWYPYYPYSPLYQENPIYVNDYSWKPYSFSSHGTGNTEGSVVNTGTGVITTTTTTNDTIETLDPGEDFTTDLAYLINQYDRVNKHVPNTDECQESNERYKQSTAIAKRYKQLMGFSPSNEEVETLDPSYFKVDISPLINWYNGVVSKYGIKTQE